MRNLFYLDMLRDKKALTPEDVQTYKLELKRRLDNGQLTPELYDTLIEQIRPKADLNKDNEDGPVR